MTTNRAMETKKGVGGRERERENELDCMENNYISFWLIHTKHVKQVKLDL